MYAFNGQAFIIDTQDMRNSRYRITAVGRHPGSFPGILKIASKLIIKTVIINNLDKATDIKG
jgi:hypothetical protein